MFIFTFLGIPGLSFDVMLMFYQKSEREKRKNSKDKTQFTHEEMMKNPRKFPGSLDLYSDPQMEQFFTRGIRGGQSFISQRYATGNAKPEEEGQHLLYVDGNITSLRCNFLDNKFQFHPSANNLYGSMETLKLPVSNFKWVDVKNWTKQDILNIPAQGDIGYAFEVDLHYPSHLHKVNIN